ncbi:nucleotide-binding domain-containing protein [Polychaeton citri CBS 116435]|uniref:NADPH:adrenodoxin oxidoreductase, mitochondrial n=1 Tax=Polychaeton citri CBS 116435 TaxID=1314669 RepID=A0A9P4QDG5_9PEZI|nr:nucleotide-binding domain-containing protein [Polychaeton citri CBS 116435]
MSWVCSKCIRNVVSRRTTNNALRTYSSVANRNHPFRLAVIGSGPAGYYTAYRILKKLPDSHVDMYESLPTPFGLVRFGVAPDHPEVKKSAETLEDVAKLPNFNFIGNVSIGSGPGKLPLQSIAPHYDAILFAYGASRDKQLGIPGEDLKGVVSARAFVGWYNGLPEYSDLNPDLTGGDNAVVIGQGNVALDVARVLLAPVDELRKTDIAEHALEALSKSRIRDVKVIGRRGPLQAPYTIKELRELMQLPDVGFAPPPEGWDALIGIEPRKSLPRQLKRIAEVLERGSPTPLQFSKKAWQLGYMRSPSAFLSQDNENLQAVGFEQTEHVRPPSSALTGDPQSDLNALRGLSARSTGNKTLVHTHLAFRSVGYASEPLPGMTSLGIPFDKARGIIPNDRWGRVISPSRGPAGPLTAGHVPGMYCAGWVKRGPTGVIASTMDDAFNTAMIILKDWTGGVKFNEMGGKGAKGGWEAVKKDAKARGLRWVSWSDWEKIDAEEKRRGQEIGRERLKCKSVEEMLKILDG